MDWAAVWLSLRLATCTTLALCVLGLPLAYWLAASQWRWKFLVEAVVALPLVLPPTVVGFFLLLFFGRNGPVGKLLLRYGQTIVFTWPATVIAAAVVLMFVYSPLLTLVFLVTAPLYALLMLFSRRWLRPLFQDLEESFARYHSYQIDAIKGIETVKAMGAEGAFRELMLSEFLGIARKEFASDFTILCYQGVIDEHVACD